MKEIAWFTGKDDQTRVMPECYCNFRPIPSDVDDYVDDYLHTHIHTHNYRERDREIERGIDR
jgi:hypothetical protein